MANPEQPADPSLLRLYDGIMTLSGDILKYTNRDKLVFGSAKDVSPAYRDYLHKVAMFAEKYPANDPHTWVPLVRAGVSEHAAEVQGLMEGDIARMTSEGTIGGPVGSATGMVAGWEHTPAPAINPEEGLTEPEVPEDPDAEDGGGFFGWVGDIVEKVAPISGAAAEMALNVTPLGGARAVAGVVTGNENPGPVDRLIATDSLIDDPGIRDTREGAIAQGHEVLDPVARTVDNALDNPVTRGPYGAFKGVVRNAFDAGRMTQQAQVGMGANIWKKATEGNYRELLMMGLTVNPATAQLLTPASISGDIAEATGIPSALPTTEERKTAFEDTWAGNQTTFGQTLIHLIEGKDVDQGSGFFTADDSEIGLAQRQARLDANTLVEAEKVTDENLVMPGAPWDQPENQPTVAELNKQYMMIANSQSTEEAEKWAQTMGMTWSASDHALTYPAQGFTYGRALAGQFYDPNTYQYNVMSGVGDFIDVGLFDPTNVIPGGAIRKGGQALLGGGRMVRQGEEAILWEREMGSLMGEDAAAKLLRRGDRAVDLGPTGAEAVLRDRTTGELLMNGGEIDTFAGSVTDLRKMGRLSVEKQVGWTGTQRASEIDAVVAKTPQIRDWMTGATVGERATPTKYVNQLLEPTSTGERRMSASQIEATRPGTKLVLRDKDDNRVLMFAEDIDASNQTPRELAQQGSLRLEKFDFETTPEIDEALSSTAPKAYKNPWLWDNGPGMVGITKADGGVWATERFMHEATYGRLRPAIDGIAAEMEPYTIYRKMNGKIDNETAVALAEAQTPDEVMGVLGPRVGAELTYFNDLQRFTVGSPAYSTWASVTRSLDMHRLKDYWMSHVSGMSFMPTESADLRNPKEVLTNMQRFGRVALTNFDDDPEMVKAMGNAMRAMAGAPGRGQRQAIFHSYLGTADDDVLMDANGRVVMASPDVKGYVSAAAEDGISKEQAIENLIHETPDAEFLGKHGHDGFLTVLAKRLVDEEGIDPGVATKITRAWRSGDEMFREAVKDARGGDFRSTYDDRPMTGAMTDADILGNTLMFPDARRLRGAISEYGKALHTLSQSDTLGKFPHERLDDAREALDTALSFTVARWKELALMAGGLRYPVYVGKQVGDTGISVLLNGGVSVLHRPMDLMKFLVTSEIRNAMETKTGEKLRRSRALNKIGVYLDNAPTPIRSMVWPGDRLRDLPTGKPISGEVRKLMDGDPGFHDIGGNDVFNVLTGGGRGGQGQDVLYGQAGRKTETIVRTVGEQGQVVGTVPLETKYIDAHADVIYQMSRGEIFRRVASGNYNAERTAIWFTTKKNADGMTMRDLVSSLNRKLAVQLRTEDGVTAYLSDVRRYVDEMTGGSQQLKDVVLNGGKINVKGKKVPMLVGNRVTADRKVSDEYRKLLQGLHKDEVTMLPDVLRRSVPDSGYGRHFWNRYMSSLFASAGRWEDIYTREPYYRQKIGEHMLDLADVMLPSERMSMAAALRRRGSPKLAGQIERRNGVGVLTRQQVETVAVARTEKDIMEVAYNAANRREWAFAARLLAPFVQAAVNGMYRWSTAAAKNPESTYRLLRAGHFLLSNDSAFISDYTFSGGVNGDPFLYQDPQTKQMMAAVPFAGAIAQQLGRMKGVPDEMLQDSGLAVPVGPTNLAAPQMAEQLQQGSDMGRPVWKSISIGLFPGVGPMIVYPASHFANGTHDWEEWLLPYGTDLGGSGTQKFTDAFFPGMVRRVMDSFSPSNEQIAASGARQAVMTAKAMSDLGLDRNDPKDWAIAEEYAARANSAMQMVQLFSTAFTPSPARIETLYRDDEKIPGHMVAVQALADIFSNYLEANPGDYGKAEAEFVSDYGLDVLAAITPSGGNSDAAPPTNAMYDLYVKDRASYDRFGPVLKYLATDRAGLGPEFNSRLYGIQVDTGEREQYSLQERLEQARQSFLDFAYFDKMRWIDSANLTDEQKTAELNALDAAMQDAEWAGFDIGTKTDRNNKAALMLEAANTPEMQQVIGTEAAGNLRLYLTTRNKAIEQMQSRGLRGDLAASTTQPERDALFMLGESLSLEDDRFAYIWWRGLRREVMPEAPEPMEGAA